MGLQQWRHRGSKDPYYTPSRDITQFFPDLVKMVAILLEAEVCGPLHDWCKASGVTMDDLGEAAGAYCRFMNLAHEVPEESVEEGLRRAGWFKVKPEAQVAYMYYVGTVTTGTFHRGIRDITELGGSASVSVMQLRWAAKRAALVCSMSSWQRFVYRWFRPYRWLLWRRHKIKGD